MKKNITYLLGAGASYNSLPILANITERLNLFRQELNSVRGHLGFETRVDPIIEDILWVIENTSNHQTIDTLAKKFFSRSSNHANLRRLKTVLATYFIYDQISCEQNSRHPNRKEIRNEPMSTRDLPDKRYDSFIATLVKNAIDDDELLGNIKVLTWNYDLQLELAYMKYWDLESLEEARTKMQSIPGEWILTHSPRSINQSQFAIVHLNGVAGFSSIKKESTTQPKTEIIDKYNGRFRVPDTMKDIIQFYEYCKKFSQEDKSQDPLSFFNYSWESLSGNYNNPNPLGSTAIENALKIAEKTEILVIIGYSFPSFNRQIDKEIISRMDRLRRVYIQDPDAQGIQSILEHAFNLRVILNSRQFFDPIRITDSTSQFTIPPEVWE